MLTRHTKLYVTFIRVIESINYMTIQRGCIGTLVIKDIKFSDLNL